jgi:translation initiation factor eIF-2B subunit delta
MDPSAPPTAAATEGPKKEKSKPANLVIPPKKPKLSKAERRELQEQQRAAKASGDGGKPSKDSKTDKKEKSAAPSSAADSSKRKPKEEKKEESNNEPSQSEDKILSLFSHLPRPKSPEKLSSINSHPSQHPAISTLGHLYSTHSLLGGNTRCRAMLQTFALILQSYSPPPTSRDYRHDVDHALKASFTYWTSSCRPHSVSMGNAFSFLKLAVANLERDLDWDSAREILIESMEAYVTERIEYAGKAISRHAGSKIVGGDVILVFGKSEVVNRLLLDAQQEGKAFRVIVVDSRPLLEGRDTLQILSRGGISCTYVLLNALSYLMMREVTKVFLGAAALMSNGSVLSRVGTACVALLAQSNHIPVLVCCETYKICNRVQLESITGNELGDANEVARTDCERVGPSNRSADEEEKKMEVLGDWKDQPNLKLLNLIYDLTPSDFVTGVVTEVGILPPTSVAVLLREMSPQENNESAFKGTD